MTDAPPLIGLCGYARSGKDAAASALTKHGYFRLSFADNLRSLAYATNPLISQPHSTNPTYLAATVDAVGWEKAKENPSVRRILQDLGLAARQTFGEDCWVDALHRQREDGKRYVITDVRFENEAQFIRSVGGKILHITRPGAEAVRPHVSEAGVQFEEADFVISNDGTLDDLCVKLMDLFNVS